MTTTISIYRATAMVCLTFGDRAIAKQNITGIIKFSHVGRRPISHTATKTTRPIASFNLHAMIVEILRSFALNYFSL